MMQPRMVSLIMIGPADLFEPGLEMLMHDPEWLCERFGLPAGYFNRMPMISRTVIAEKKPKQESQHED